MSSWLPIEKFWCSVERYIPMKRQSPYRMYILVAYIDVCSVFLKAAAFGHEARHCHAVCISGWQTLL